MPQYKIDLKARIFQPEDRAWRLFPGDGYRYYDIMRERSVVFLDLPDITLPREGSVEENEEFKEELAKAEEIQRALRLPDEEIEGAVREAKEKDYSRARWGQKRYSERGAVRQLYEVAKSGDLVLMPGPGFFRDAEKKIVQKKTLVGEIVSDRNERLNRGVGFRNMMANYLVRRVSWLAEVDERSLSPKILLSLRTQNPLVSLPKDDLEPTLGAAYRNVLIGDEYLSRFTTKKLEFNSKDSFHFQAFIMAVVEAFDRIRSEDAEPAWPDSIYEMAARSEAAAELIPEQDANIHSPGYTSLKSGVLIPFVVAALFPLALAAEGDGVAPETVTVENSGSGVPHACVTQTEEAVKQTLEIMGLERWRELCIAAAKAHQGDGLAPVSTVEIEE